MNDDLQDIITYYNCDPLKEHSRWLYVLERVSAAPPIVGALRHLLYIGRKTGL